MRLLVLLLLLVNLGLYGWHRFAPVPEPTAPTVDSAPGQRLTLLSELSPAAPGECYAAGPFEQSAADSLAKRLVSSGYEPRQSKEERLTPLGFWVYIPPAGSLEAAQETGRRLAERGIQDYVFVVGAEKANAISLGLFPDQSAAEVRVAQIQALGFEPRLEQRYSRSVNVTVSVSLNPAQAPPTGQDIAWRRTAC